jgi:RNA polymerase sigma-70 factor (ECF subfamily)
MVRDDTSARTELDERVRSLLASGNATAAATETLRCLGPEVLGFISGVVGDDADADEIFAAMSERLWHSLVSFEWRCSLRTWAYVIARHEISRFRRRTRRHLAGRVRISELADAIAAVQSETRSTQRSARRRKLTLLRDELPPDDRTLLVLRVDRNLSWDEIALVFIQDPRRCTEEERKREAARLRKRFQLVKERLAKRVRDEGLLPE